jgi:hypothetical protein
MVIDALTVRILMENCTEAKTVVIILI